MKANTDKCHFLLSRKEKPKANISNYITTNTDKEKLQEVAIDNLIKYETNIANLCGKAR